MVLACARPCWPSAEGVKKIGSKSVARVELPQSHHVHHLHHHEDSQYQVEERLPWSGSLTDIQGSGQVQPGPDRSLHLPAGPGRAGPEVRSEEGGQDPDDQQEISQEYRGVHRHSEEIQELR